jgi:hypothetical protein
MNETQPPADEKLMPTDEQRDRWMRAALGHLAPAGTWPCDLLQRMWHARSREEAIEMAKHAQGRFRDLWGAWDGSADPQKLGPVAGSWATPPAAPAESVTELCANHDNLREYIGQLERERDEAKARAIQAWKDADAAILKEVESRVASIMGSPDNEIARLTASRNVFRDERDALQAERNTLRSQLAHARSRGDDKEIAEKERDAARAELAKTQSHLKHNEEVYVRLEKELRAELAVLRRAMIYAINYAGGAVSEECTTKFLCMGADQVKLHVEHLRAKLAALRAKP